MSKRKQKKQRPVTSIVVCTRRRDLPFLSRDIMFNILSWLPAEFLHNDAKYVSKAWADIIRDPFFIKMHLLRHSSDVGLLIHDHDNPWRNRYLEAKDGKIKVTRQKYYVPGELPLASCEGMLLLRPYDDYLYVGNCVTEQGLMLPCHRIPTCKLEDKGPWSGLSRITQSGALKVIFACEGFNGLRHWHVLTVGVDKSWRKIECEFTGDEYRTTTIQPISVNEIIYWLRMGQRCFKFPAIDLRDESVHWIRVPEGVDYLEQCFSHYELSTFWLLKLGNYLSCIVASKSNQMEMNEWILKDMVSSTWVKIRSFLCNVGLEVPIVWTIRGKYTPIAWLDNGRVLVFAKCRGHYKPSMYVVYNLTTKKLRYLCNVNPNCAFLAVDHINTLVSL